MAKNQEVPSKPLPVVLRNAGSAPYNTAENNLTSVQQKMTTPTTEANTNWNVLMLLIVFEWCDWIINYSLEISSEYEGFTV